MAHVRIEMDRGNGWELRSEGDTLLTNDETAAALTEFAIQYPHRAVIDGAVIAEANPVRVTGVRLGKDGRYRVAR